MPPSISTPVIESDTIVYLENVHCRVTSDDSLEMRCATQGKMGTVTLFILGTLLIYASIGLFAWSLPSGRLQGLLLGSGASLFVVGVFFQWRGMVRHRELGTCVIDREQRRVRTGRGGWAFEDVARIRLTVDISGVLRVGARPGLPYWLVLHMANGKRFRIAWGSRQALQPVIDWLAEAGITSAPAPGAGR